MTTRRIEKKWRKEDWLSTVDEVIEMVVRSLNRVALNARPVGKAADEFLRGETDSFVMMPFRVAGMPDDAFYFVFERWPLRVMFLTDGKALKAASLEADHGNRRGSRPDIQVRFSEVGYREMKRELLEKYPRRPTIGPGGTSK